MPFVGMIQARIDRMEEFDQLVIKTASILGMTFTRVLLWAILPSGTTPDSFGEALQRLADSGIFMCSSPASRSQKTSTTSGKAQTVTCLCTLADGSSNEKPMRECLLLRFQSGSLQETAYQMLLENARKPLHKKAALFLESMAHKCQVMSHNDNDDHQDFDELKFLCSLTPGWPLTPESS